MGDLDEARNALAARDATITGLTATITDQAATIAEEKAVHAFWLFKNRAEHSGKRPGEFLREFNPKCKKKFGFTLTEEDVRPKSDDDCWS
jgi:hypothetical protein